MIGKVLRGRDVGGLLRYLFGPGRANEHTDPHLVVSWDDVPTALEPAVAARGRRDVGPLARLLEQPLAATARHPEQPVWHCSLRVAPGDRRLSDGEWREVARDVVDATGLAPRDDDGACRWVAVRHADDHVHVVVTLARQDGRAARVSNDFYRVGEACRSAERRLGLTLTAPRDRTAARRPTRGESEKALRQRRAEPARVQLRRAVRTAAAGAATSDEFVVRLEQAGLLVRLRHSENEPGTVTGFAVALPGDRAAMGRPIWFGGGALAADMTWPKLSARWQGTSERGATPSAQGRLSRAERAALWRQATSAATSAAARLHHPSADPAAGADLAHATGDVLAVVAHLVEGRRRGPLSAAADAFDRAARDLHGRVPAPTRQGAGLRAAARLLAVAGRAGRDETAQLLALVTELAAVSDAVAQLREVQERAAQASAARLAAERLRTWLPADLPADVHTLQPRPPVHAAARRPAVAVSSRGRVRS